MKKTLHTCLNSIAWVGMMVMLLLAVPKADARVSTTLLSEDFSEGYIPSPGWNSDNYSWGGSYWSSAGAGGYNGSWVFDMWDCNYDYIYAPEVDLSGFTSEGDVVTIEFDYYSEYNWYDQDAASWAGEGGSQFQLYFDDGSGNYWSNPTLVDNTVTSSYYTYNSGADYQIYDPDVSSSSWRHYKITIPAEYRYSTFRAVFFAQAYYNCNGGNIAIDNVTITGSKPQLASYAPTNLDFGKISEGVTSASQCVTVTNTSAAPINVSSVILAGANSSDFVITGVVPTVIDAFSNANFCVAFKPTTNGPRSASLVINNASDNNAEISVPLTGIGLAPIMNLIPVGAHNTTSKMFAQTRTTLGDTLEQMILVQNIGSGNLHVSNATNISGTWMNQYTISQLPAVTGIPAGETDTIKVKHIPTNEGLHQAVLNIVNDGVDGTKSLTLTGVGILPKIVITPSVVRFDSTKIGDTVCMAVTVYNPGSDTLKIKNQTITSTEGDFIFGLLNPELTAIPPDKSRTISICFNPKQAGSREATLVLKTNIPRTFENVRRDTGTTVIPIAGTGVPYGSLALISGAGGNDSAIINTQVCHVDTLMNVGDAPVTVNSLTISGMDMADFSLSGVATPFLLGAHAKRAITVCGTPSQHGLRQGVLTVDGTSGDLPSSTTIPLHVYGLSVCAAANPSDGLFANVKVVKSTDSVMCVTVTNCGDVAATYTTRLTDRTNYTVTPSQSASINPGDSATFCVTFSPSTTGELDSKLIISSANIADMPIDLKGIGACSILSTEGFTVPTTNAGGHSTFQITLNNTGNFDYNLGTPVLTQSATAYRIVPPAPTSIPAGGNVQITIGYDPTDVTTTYTGELTFPDGGPCAESSIKADFSNTTGTEGVTAQSVQNGFALEQNYPNPASHTTNFDFVMPREAAVTVTISDLTGKLVQTLISGRLNQGVHTVNFDATSLAAGTYVYTLESDGVRLSRTMILQK